MFTVVMIVLIASAIGASARLLNQTRSLQSNRRKNRSVNGIDVFSSLLNSLVAASLVPSVASLLGSAALLEIPKDWTKQIVLFGFCLGAAVLGEQFTTPILSRMLAEVEKQGVQVEKVEGRQAAILETLSEPAVKSDGPMKMSQFSAEGVSEEERKRRDLIQLFHQSTWHFRSFVGLNEVSALPSDELKRLVDTLVTEQVLGTVKGSDDEPRWYLKSA